MLWMVALLYIAGGGLGAAAAVVVLYRISWMKVWEAGAAIETKLFSSWLQRAREQAASSPTDAQLAKKV